MDSENKDIRWHQRFENYQKAITRLAKDATITENRELSDLEKQGLIQGFEYTHELAWKTIKDYFIAKGENKIYGSRDATRLAFKYELIIEGEIWMTMIDDRNLSSHTYKEDVVEKILGHILESYVSEFQKFKVVMEKIINGK